MSVDATTSSSSASVSLAPVGDDPPKADDKKADEKKQLDQQAAANAPAPSSVKRDVVVFAVKVTRDGAGRDYAKGVGAGVLGAACVAATKATLDVAASGLGPVGKAAAGIGSGVAGFVVGLGCAPAGAEIGGKVYDAVTGGPNKLVFEKQTVQVEVPAASARADAQPPAAKGAEAAKSKPAPPPPAKAPTTNASTLPDPVGPTSSAWTDPSGSYLRSDAASK